MPLLVVGLNHKTATVDLRGKIAFDEAMLSQALTAFCQQTGASEALILSTCNRVELYATGVSNNDMITWLCTYHSIPHQELAPHLYVQQGISALEHAMRVACSLDSMVIGEPQILGQLKQAYSTAIQAGTATNQLHRAFQFVFAAAKQVRTETAIGHCPVSVAHSAIQLARTQLPDLSAASIAVIGAGNTAKLLIKHLSQMNLKSLKVINRSIDKAQLAFADTNADIHGLSELNTLLPDLDIVLTATSSPEPIITQKEALAARSTCKRPLYLLDLSSPRNIAAEVSELPFVHLSCIDDLQAIVKHHSLQRSEAAVRADEIIQIHISRYLQSMEARNAAGVIRAIRNQASEVCEIELNKSLKALAQGEHPETVLRQFAYSITNKWTHQPSSYLNQASAQGEIEVLHLAQKLFGITDAKH